MASPAMIGLLVPCLVANAVTGATLTAFTPKRKK